MIIQIVAFTRRLLQLVIKQNDRSMYVISARILFLYARAHEIAGLVSESYRYVHVIWHISHTA